MKRHLEEVMNWTWSNSNGCEQLKEDLEAMTGMMVLSTRRTVTNGFQASLCVSSVSTILDFSSMSTSTNILQETYECVISLS